MGAGDMMRTRRSIKLRHLVWPVGLVVVATSTAMLQGEATTTYGGLGPWWAAAEAGAAAALIAAATAAAAGERRMLALAAAATGLLWLAPEWAGWVAGPAWARSVGSAMGALLPAAALTLAVTAAGIDDRLRRVLTRSALGVAVAVAAVRLVLVDPFLDPHCWRVCGHNPLLLMEVPAVARGAEILGVALTVGLMTATVIAVVARQRRALDDVAWWLVAFGGAALLAGLSVPAVARLTVTENPQAAPFTLSFMLANAGAVAIAGALVVDRVREWRLRVGLTRLVEGLRAAHAGSLEGALARTLEDPALRLAYWSQTRRGYLDAGGREVTLPATGSSAVTTILRRGQPVAALVHAAGIDSQRIERVIGPAVRLSLENEQLRAATLAELAELHASRARIVEQSEAERRRLERNLHDGAQQRVLGIALLLRMARARAGAAQDAAVIALLARAEQLLELALDDLRRIGRGLDLVGEGRP